MVVRLSTAQAAARLGVKRATLYSYVSRGLLSSERMTDSVGSTFDPMEVETLARNRRARSRVPVAGSPLMVLDSAITLIRSDELFYRGVPAVRLAMSSSFEQVASLVWKAGDDLVFAPFEEVVELTRHSPLDGARPVDLFLHTLLLAAMHDPVKWDLTTPTVWTLASRAIATMVAALPGETVPSGSSIASALWSKLSPLPGSAGDRKLLNAALVLLIDHDLAASTIAARVAASARAHPYAALTSAFGAFDSVLHGHASSRAAAMLTEVVATGNPEAAISRQLAEGKGIPGFGHVLYPERDPRAIVLLRLMRTMPRYREVTHAADRITAVVISRTNRMPNIDLALAALTIGGRMDPNAGQAIFGLARCVGWTAHILEEYSESPLRLRPASNYVGVKPT